LDPAALDAVILTHAHLDHSGYVPLLVKHGFAGPVYCTRATRELCAILLPDSGRLQEEDAAYANRQGFSKHKPALPLYTEKDAKHALRRLTPVAFEQDVDLGDGVSVRLSPAGHILGAALVTLRHAGTSLLFSGDLGRSNDLLMPPPTVVRSADYLVVESTYGDRRHDPRDPHDVLAEICNRTFERGGAVIVPAFAVGRTQALMYCIHLLKEAKAIPDVPVFLNSPMAVNVTRVFHNHRGEHRLTPEQCDGMCNAARYVNSVEESKTLNVKGVFFCTKHAIPHLKRAGGGSIINLSSIYGIVSAPDVPPYHASKGAVRLMTKTDALLYAGDRIRVNSVHPGFIWTPMVEGYLASQGDVTAGRAAVDRLHPLGRMGEPDDIAYGVLYLASDESKFVTGTELVIDGGYTCR
jgi:NAD(P)-dependent dehydrogenase (short-subunit alcohol dehydrogenase family)